ncbi:MAG: hypothetical protein J5896_03640, partial [Alphaproteobacteria bacterium]|nr:hypothetical protein [Alphaproteobacteria bacterium]
NLELTDTALAQLKESVEQLKYAAEAKKNSLRQQKGAYEGSIYNKNKQIDALKQAIGRAVETIEQSAQKISEVTKQNGTGNNSD